MNKHVVINCCQAQIKVVNGGEGTSYFECTNCHKPCNIYSYPPEPAVTKPNPESSFNKYHKLGCPAVDMDYNTTMYPCYCGLSQKITKAVEEKEKEIYTQVSEKIGENIDKTLEVSAISGIDSATLFLKNFRSLQHALYQWDNKGCGDQLKSEEKKMKTTLNPCTTNGDSIVIELRKCKEEKK